MMTAVAWGGADLGVTDRAIDGVISGVVQLFELAGLEPPAAEDVTSFADIKRFEERWHADPKFRSSYAQEPRSIGAAFGLRVDPEIVRSVWDPNHSRDQAALPPVLVRYLKFKSLQSRHFVDGTAAGYPIDPRFARWRQRQIHRADLEMGVSFSPNPHIPASIELSLGCSVGCWFCSLSPPKLGDVFPYTEQNARLWRQLLEVIRHVSGPAARRTICYSGTDPFDNPDYERFAEDFAAVLGNLPFTSTAIPTRDVERTRRLLAILPAYRMRFSVLSLGALSRIHAEFSPEETLPVRVGLRNEGAADAPFIKFAGRARENVARYRKYQPGPPLIGTPACVSGFLFNLVDRSIELISPCAPDDRRPMGYRVYDKARFDTAEDIDRIVQDMMSRHMTATADDLPVLRFMSCLRYEPIDKGFALTGPRMRQRFESTADMPAMARLGELVSSGTNNANAVVALLDRECGIAREAAAATIEELFQLGVLEEETPC